MQSQSNPSPSDTFLFDTQDLFTKRRFAHMGNHRFSLPSHKADIVRGLNIWNDMHERSKQGGAYYIFSDEVEMLNQYFPDWISLLPENLVLIDLGVGSQEAIIDKIGAVLKNSQGKITHYIGVDLVGDVLKEAKAVFKDYFPEISFKAIRGDIFSALELPKDKPNLSAVFGQTLFNIKADPRKSDVIKFKIVQMLKALRANMKSDDYLALPQNCSENLDEIHAAYNEQKDVWLNLFHKMQRDLPIRGKFDPEGFAFEPHWIDASKIISHTIIPKKSMKFTLGGQGVYIGLKDRFYMHNTVIYPKDEFSKLLEKADLSVFKQEINSKKRMSFNLLRPT